MPTDADSPSPSRTAPDIRTEGQRMLLEVPASLGEIAEACGVASRRTVGAWRRGEYVPEDKFRAALEAEYRIPRAAWATPIGGEVPPDAPPDAPPATDGDDDAEQSLEADYGLLLKEMRKQLRGPLTARERAQITDAFSRTLKSRAAIEQQREMLEDRTIRAHPKWRRLRDAIIAALIPHPAAARDVEAAINRVVGAEEAEAATTTRAPLDDDDD